MVGIKELHIDYLWRVIYRNPHRSAKQQIKAARIAERLLTTFFLFLSLLKRVEGAP